jgi:ATP-dependent RNA helicase RhlE
MKINELKLSKEIINSMNNLGYSTLTPIEEKAIPIILDNKDLIGIAKTGSGKTLAYAIPLIERELLSKDHKNIKSLILVPTRELAMQVRNEVMLVGKDHLKTAVIMGGVAQSKQLKELKRGVDILVATPGRLNDLIKQGKITLAFVDKVVLDEADTMLDMGFINDIELILSKLLKERQTLMFTATMGNAIKDFAERNLHNPINITIEQPKEEIPEITEELYFMDGKNKNDFLLSYLSNNRINEAIIFTRTKKGADSLCRYLNSYNLKAVAIHSDKRQNERTRNLRLFKEQKVNFLIATDIAARGIDIKNLPLVINYNLPDQPELYIHRIGRTGRAGASGKAISICTPEEKNYLFDIQKLLKKDIPLINDEKYSIELIRKGKNNNHQEFSHKSHSNNFKKNKLNNDFHDFKSNNENHNKSFTNNSSNNFHKNFNHNKNKNKKYTTHNHKHNFKKNVNNS